MKVLVTRLGGRRVALPLEHVVETMRLLPIDAVGSGAAGATPWLRGLCRIRGAAVPVVDGARLLGDAPTGTATAARLVLLRVGERRVALAVDEVVGVVTLDGAEAPPLLQSAGEQLRAVGVHDTQLVLVLNTTRLVPDALWAELQVAAT